MRLQVFVVLLTLLLCVGWVHEVRCKDKELLKLFGLSRKAKQSDVHVRKQAPEDTFSYYVSLRNSFGTHFCGGTLISSRYILTAASCMDTAVFGIRVAKPTANIGTFLQEPPATKRPIGKDDCKPEINKKIAKVIFHDKYSNGTEGRPPYDTRYDIALLKLKKPSKMEWARLPLEKSDCCDGVDLLNVGLGRSQAGGPYAVSLEMAVFPSMPFSRCSRHFKRSDNKYFGSGRRNLTSTTSLCVSGEGDYCHLDFGSALVSYRGEDRPPVVAGFANRATQECTFGDPHVFTDVSFHIPWIQSIKGVLKDIAASDKTSDLCTRSPKSGTKGRVLGGSTARPGRFPYAVSVRRRGLFHECQGVLISPRHVLTAGSCVDPVTNPDPKSIELYIGGSHLDPGSEKRKHDLIAARKVNLHPRYAEKHRGVNLAIIELAQNSSFPPVRLPFSSRDCCEEGTQMRVFGWGSSFPGRSPAELLQTGVMSYIPKKICRRKHGLTGVNPVAICGGGESTRATLCNGDNGTPMLLTGAAEDILIGIGFADTSMACGNTPTEFLRIAFFLKWIKSEVPYV